MELIENYCNIVINSNLLMRLSDKNEIPKTIDNNFLLSSSSISSFKLLEINQIIKDNNIYHNKFADNIQYKSKLEFVCEITRRCYNRGYIWGSDVCMLIDRIDINIYAITKVNTDFGLFNIDDICVIEMDEETNKLNIYNINDESDLFFLSILFVK